MSETEGGQTDEGGRRRHRGQTDDADADDIADKQTTQTATRGISTRVRVSTVKRSHLQQGQKTQFERLGRRTTTNTRTNDRSPFRIVNPPTHSCCAMPRFIGAPSGAGYLLAMPPAWGRNQVDTRDRARTNPEREARSSRERLKTTRTRFRGH